ncbi:hypothetical protein EPA93_34495 [Ktedonosporobacter rubrisoli]|uniref:Uncharacterized protein n=1 Tax=Ktedonosporobacter rubrisoli TaxID=2509675 RepID=A0A4P6K086_KTERU|nr:hypothetical protein [Ktedonosporobacter rubrisoli]QBD80806.1 hypothetical protein EPA93_34495 [Ktedonosporobacter rubrisoli]
MEQQYNSDRLPTISLNQRELQAINAIIEGYLPHLRRKLPYPYKTIKLLDDVRRKLAPALKPGAFPAGEALALSLEELQAIGIALQGFVALIYKIIPHSPERNATLEDLNKLRAAIEAILHPGEGA